MQPTEIVIRNAEEADALAVNELVAEGRADAYINPEYGIDLEWIRHMRARMLSDEELDKTQDNITWAHKQPQEAIYRVATKDSEIVGIMFGHDASYKGENFQLLDLLFVLKQMRGHHIGQLLTREYIEWSDPVETSKLWVVAYSPAVGFYQRLGFQIIPGADEIIENIPRHITTYNQEKQK
jgi:GNAT superfamily N-acetyltransferase